MTYLHCIVVSILQAMIEEIIFHFYEMFTITLPSFIHGGFILKIIQKVSSSLMDELIYFKQQLPNWKNFLQLNGLEHVKKKYQFSYIHNQRFYLLKDVHLLRCSSQSVCSQKPGWKIVLWPKRWWWPPSLSNYQVIYEEGVTQLD